MPTLSYLTAAFWSRFFLLLYFLKSCNIHKNKIERCFIMFDLPKDPDWGQEYFGGIFIVFNEAVLKSDVLDDIKDAANLNPKAIRFLSIFKDEFEEVDIEDDIQDYSLEDIKKYFYLYIKGDLISEALGAKMDADALGESEYRFAFVVASGASNKDFLAESIKKQVPQVKRTLVV